MIIRYCKKIDDLVVITRIMVADEHCWGVLALCDKHFGKANPESDKRYQIMMATKRKKK